MNYKETYTGNNLPALMKETDESISFVSNGPLEVGDTYETNRFNPKINGHVKRVILITEIIEWRPAKGDWSGDLWKNTTPIWNLCKVL